MRVLIVKTSSLGDIIHAFPVLSYLHERHSSLEIDWVVEESFSELVRAHPLVNRVFCINTKQWRTGKGLTNLFHTKKAIQEHHYDVVFDLQGNTKSALVTWWVRSQDKVGYGKGLVFEWPNLLVTNLKFTPDSSVNVREENLFLPRSYFQDHQPFQDSGVTLKITTKEQQQIDQILHALSSKKKIIVCPGSTWINKQMSPESLIVFLRKIPDATFLLTWGNASEKKIVEQLHASIENSQIIPRFSIPALQNLMSSMDLVIAMDSLPLHLASTTSVATYSIFGPSSASKYQPLGPQHTSFQGTCPYNRSFSRRCPILRSCKTGACMRHLTGNEVFASFKKES